MKRRPAADLGAAPGDFAERTAWIAQRARGPELLAWSDHILQMLIPQLRGLQGKVGSNSTAELTVWSDCGGMSMEMLAMRDITDSLERITGFLAKPKIFSYCDIDHACRCFAEANHNPAHMSDDIMARNFADGTYFCATHK